MIDLTTEQRQLAKIVHDYACQFPPTENGDAQLLQGCYDYMDAFKRVMDSASKVQIDYICLQYPGYFRWSDWLRGSLMELLRSREIIKNLYPEILVISGLQPK